MSWLSLFLTFISNESMFSVHIELECLNMLKQISVNIKKKFKSA